ncbi:MAG: TetR/AcrR family transcriptional regulator [Parvularculaceae bacterium]
MAEAVDIAEERTRGRKPDPAKDEAILAAARELFLEKGYSASIDDIAERAGVVKQTVYARFKSKEDLFAAVIRSTAEELVAPLSGPDRDRSVRDTLTAIAEQYHRILLEPKRIQMARLMIAEAAKFPDLARRYYEVGPSYVCGRLADYLDDATASGALHVADSKLAASQLFGMIKGVEHLGALLGVSPAENELNRRRRIAAAVDAFLRLYG